MRQVFLLKFFSLLCITSSFFYGLSAQDRQISGLVSDESNAPLPGVNVQIKGTYQGVATDSDGRFSIQVATNSTLIFTAIGFKTQEVILGNQSEIQVQLITQIGTLDEIIITANRQAQAIEDVPQQVIVIDKSDIEQNVALDITDVLKKNAGIDVIQYPGLLSGIGIRGFQPQFSGLNQRSLLLLNGRPAGTTNLALINVQDIERIEVLKGPASALYGSQAMGGVVNVITRKSRGSINTQLYAEYGSFSRFQAGVQTGGNITNRLDFDASFNLLDRAQNFRLGDGNVFRRLFDNDEATKTFFDETTAVVDDTQGDGEIRPNTTLNNYSGSLRLGYQLNEQWRIDVSGGQFVGRNVDLPGDIAVGSTGAGRKNIDRYTGDFKLSGQLSEKNRLHFTAYIASEGSENITLNDFAGNPVPAFRSFTEDNRWWGLQIQDISEFGNHSLTVGLDYNHARTRSQLFGQDGSILNPFSPNYSNISTGLYAQGQLNFLDNRLVINPGLRYDIITFDVEGGSLLFAEQSGGRETNPFFSPSLAAQYRLFKSFKIHGSVGRAFVNPNSFQVAGFSEQIVGDRLITVTEGNPDLDNENSVTWDLGLEYDSYDLGLRLDVTYFRTVVRDRITTRTETPFGLVNNAGDTITAISRFVNADESEISGLEVQASYDFGALSNYDYSLRLFFNGTALFRAEDVAVGLDGNSSTSEIRDVANLNLNYGIEYDNLKWLQARLTGRYVGQQMDFDFNDPLFPLIEYPGFMVLDAVISYTYQQKHKVSLFINNITDENYYEKRGFNLPGRAFFLRYTLNL